MDTEFSTYWTLYFHHPTNNDWGIESYQKIAEIKTPKDFWNIFSCLGNDIIENSMLFFMKEDIPPLWEDERNKNGGCWSFKIYKKHINKTWIDLCSYILTNELTVNTMDSSIITGITISPKRSFSIIKIWNNDATKNNTKLLKDDIPNVNLEESIYKAHGER